MKIIHTTIQPNTSKQKQTTTRTGGNTTKKTTTRSSQCSSIFFIFFYIFYIYFFNIKKHIIQIFIYWLNITLINMNNSKENMPKETKKITLGLVLSWIFGVLFGLNGLTFLFSGSIVAGGSLILASLILLPPINKVVKEKFNFELSRGLKITLVIILFVIYAVNLPSSNIFKDDVKIQPTENVNQPSETSTPSNTQTTPTQPPKQKVKSATLSIDRVQIQVANLYPTRITITNTGNVSISPKFDLYVYDNNNNEVCSGSPLFDEIGTLSSGEKQTGEISIMGCVFKKDGTYTLKVDLLDEDYNKLDSDTDDFSVNYWS